MNTSLLPEFANIIRNLSDAAAADPQSIKSLLIQRVDRSQRAIEMVYAPFDYVNGTARLAIVGLTPGRQQASNAIVAARKALLRGASVECAAAEAKVYASFSGPMRGNLIRLLDHIGVARLIGIRSTSELWTHHSDLAHFTSALRYPVFVDGQNYTGQPDMLGIDAMRAWLERYTGQELSKMPQALIVPLGPRVTAAMEHLANSGLIDRNRVLSGLPHPSGANAERISCFLGDKPAHLVSAKTNAANLHRSRENLVRQVQTLM